MKSRAPFVLCVYLFCTAIAVASPTNRFSVNAIRPIVPDLGECGGSSVVGSLCKAVGSKVKKQKPFTDYAWKELAVGTSSQDLSRLYESSQDPEVRPGLFEGDIAVTNEYFDYWRIGLRWDVFPDKLWENKTVPYVISPLYDAADYVKINKAITYINYMTCVKFISWDGRAKDFLLIWPMMHPKGCWSFVGKFGGAQILSLEPPDEKGPNCLENEGRAIHELMHALGIFHEHSRADRDTYIDIHYENIIPGFRSNFNKQSPENATYNYEYGYDSIMHYGNYFFSVDSKKPTITPKMPGVTIGQRKAMSKTDCLKLNDLYGCLDKPEEARIYRNICKTLGL